MPTVVLDWDKSYRKGIIISEDLESIRNYFSIPNESASIIKKRYANSFIPRRCHVITNTGRFNKGLYFSIISYLDNQEDYEIVTTPLLTDQLLCGFDVTKYKAPELNMTLRDFQTESILKGLHFGYGTFLIGTGGGKTYLMATLEKAFREFIKTNFTTLICLPAQLVEQTYKDFISYGINKEIISKWSGKNELTTTPIIIASYKTLHSKLNSFSHLTPKAASLFKDKQEYDDYMTQFKFDYQNREYKWKQTKKDILNRLNNVDLLFCDEVHTLREKNKLNKIINLFPTNHKFGFTGTLPESKIDIWNIIGKIGPILSDISSFELRQKKVLSNVAVQILQLQYKNAPKFKSTIEEPTKAYNEECDYIYMHPFRNKIISKLSQNFKNNALIIVDKIRHGEELYNCLTQSTTNKQIYWIRGETEMVEREKIRELMEKEDNIICIAMAKIFSTGINIKNLHYILLASAGKAKVTLIQSIGRGLRLNENKSLLIIIDLADMLRYGPLHLQKRIEQYEKEKIEYELKDLCEP